jgi:glycosyltransferase involved in cell wall biosynthesis
MTVAAAAPRVAVLHDYLVQYGGAERVVEELCGLWPDADLFTTFHDRQHMAGLGFQVPGSVRALLPSWLPHAGRMAKWWTFVYPLAWRCLNLEGYDLVISSSSFAAHHARVSPDTPHISYCHSPPRFLYGLTTELNHGRIRRLFPLARLLYRWLRRLDQAAARRVTSFVANSSEVQRRIARVYGREAIVIYPPVDTEAFATVIPKPGEYFLTWGRLVGSKRIDLLIQGANLAGVPLVVAGTGPVESRLRRLAGPTVSFVGRVTDQERLRLLESCRAVVFAAEEDFGMVPVEAMAGGKPVIAYGAGGALESVIPGVTGELFSDRTPEALAALMEHWDDSRYQPSSCRARAAEFDKRKFRERMREFGESFLSPTIASGPSIG